jgi:predicted transposase YbfD/YdcC
VRQVFTIRREITRIKPNKTTIEIIQGLTSLSAQKADPGRPFHLNRARWSIENRLHWIRDVTFDQDRSQIRTRNAP